MLHILTKFHDDDIVQPKFMAILSTGASGILSVSYRNLKKKETDVIVKKNWSECITWYTLLTQIIKVSIF